MKLTVQLAGIQIIKNIITTVPNIYMQLTAQLAGIQMSKDTIITVPSIYLQWNWLYN